MRELTTHELKAVSGGLSAVVRKPAHPLLALLVAVILKALGRKAPPPTRAVEVA
jgi:bacteriocin-like protein